MFASRVLQRIGLIALFGGANLGLSSCASDRVVAKTPMLIDLQQYESAGQNAASFRLEGSAEPTTIHDAVAPKRLIAIQRQEGLVTGQGLDVDGETIHFTTFVLAVQPIVRMGAAARQQLLAGLSSPDEFLRTGAYLALLGIYRVPLDFKPRLDPSDLESREAVALWTDITSRLAPAQIESEPLERHPGLRESRPF